MSIADDLRLLFIRWSELARTNTHGGDEDLARSLRLFAGESDQAAAQTLGMRQRNWLNNVTALHAFVRDRGGGRTGYGDRGLRVRMRRKSIWLTGFGSNAAIMDRLVRISVNVSKRFRASSGVPGKKRGTGKSTDTRPSLLSMPDDRAGQAWTGQSGNSRSGRAINGWPSVKAVCPNIARTN